MALLVEEMNLHTMLIGYFNKLCKQQKGIGSLSLFNKLSTLILAKHT